MVFLKKFKWLLVVLPVLFVVASASAQEPFVFKEGQTSELKIIKKDGEFYYWKIYTDNSLSLEATTAEAEFVNGNQGEFVTVKWKKRGNYFFTLTITGINGCKNLKVGHVRVMPIVLQAVAGENKVIGTCQSASLDASKSLGEITNYHWQMLDSYGSLSKPDGKFTEFRISRFYQGKYPADFRIVLHVSDIHGNVDTDTLTVTIAQEPVADIYISGNLEKDGSMIVDGSVSKGVGINYFWYTNAGSIIGDIHKPLATVNGPGIYNLEVTDIFGCKSLKSFQFPLKSSILVANKDYGRIPWDQDIKIPVLENDVDSDNDIDKGSLQIMENPKRGNVVINSDGTINYSAFENKSGRDQFIYQVCDSLGACDSAMVLIDIYETGLTVPEAFSPNGDGLNETLEFKGLLNYPPSQLYVYTRAGMMVYHSPEYRNDWNGKWMARNQQLPTNTYYYVLKLGGTNRIIKGFVFIDY